MEHILLKVRYRFQPTEAKTESSKGADMKILDKVELIVKLKEKIEEAKKDNAKAAQRLQGLLESVMKSGEYKAV